MSIIYAIANQKGGVGKTTTAVNLAACLADCGQSVLLIDLDPQGNATMGSGVDKSDLDISVYDVLVDDVSVQEAKATSENINYDVLPANGDLTAAEVALMHAPQRQQRLKSALAQVADVYDFVVIDCPPSLNMLTVNALVAAQGVIIPMQCEYYALEGLSALLNTVGKIAASVNSGLKVEGIIRTMFDARSSLANDVAAQLHQHFGKKVYRTVIPRNVRLAEAPSYGMPASRYDKSSKGALAYNALALEVLKRTGLQAA